MDDGNTTQQAFIRDLQTAREYQQVTLEWVAEVTHISLDFLRALEEGEWERIPLPFLRGYLTAYAECVGMVREKVLKRFDELNWQPAPAPMREEPVLQPVLPRVPFPMRRKEAELPPEPVYSTRAPETLVPSFWDVIPASTKGWVAGSLIAVLLLLAGVTFWLLGGGSASGDERDDAPLPELSSESATTLQGFTPFRFQVRLRQTGPLQVRTQDGVLFDGTLPKDSTLNLVSALEVELHTVRLEDLQLWRDDHALDLPKEQGPAELRLASESVRVVRRTQ